MGFLFFFYLALFFFFRPTDRPIFFRLNKTESNSWSQLDNPAFISGNMDTKCWSVFWGGGVQPWNLNKYNISPPQWTPLIHCIPGIMLYYVISMVLYVPMTFTIRHTGRFIYILLISAPVCLQCIASVDSLLAYSSYLYFSWRDLHIIVNLQKEMGPTSTLVIHIRRSTVSYSQRSSRRPCHLPHFLW